jgi:hypothetical protein
MTRTFWDSAHFSFRGLIGGVLVLFVALSVLPAVATAQNPVPLINQPLVPDAIAPASQPLGFTLTVNGTGFVSNSVVRWDGIPRSTTFVSSSRLTARILTLDFMRPGTASVTVFNPGPGGGLSNTVPFQVTATAAPMTMGAPLDIGVVNNLSVVATADFNGDGKVDIAADEDLDLTIMLGNGDGTFRQGNSYSVGAEPAISLTVGDFNQDGNPDLVVLVGGKVVIFGGNGDGTFSQVGSYSAGTDPRAAVVGDFNRDGKLDLAVANEISNDVSILLGNGNGTFQAPMNFAVGSEAWTLALGDFNRDGRLDLAVATPDSGTVNILLGYGDGTFQAPVSYPLPSTVELVVGDFNTDTKLDLIAATPDGVSVLIGNGDGTFQPAVSYGTGGTPELSAGGDFDGDKKLDVAVVNSEGTVSILLGNNDGTFRTPVQYPCCAYPFSLAIGDFNRDGRLDMATSANAMNGRVSVLLQNDLNFPYQLVGTRSVPRAITLSNISRSPLTISRIEISGAGAGDFSQTNNCGVSLPPGGFCTVTATFTPGQEGPRAATLLLTHDGLGSPQPVTLAGAGTVVSLSPPILDFGPVPSGHHKTLATTLTNTGTSPLHITSVAIIQHSGPWFTQTNNCPATLDAGEYCTIMVVFSPYFTRTYRAELSISDDGGGSPQQVLLTGTGVR